MKNIKIFLAFFCLILFFYIAHTFVNLPSGKISPEISINSLSPYGKSFGKVVAASCGYPDGPAPSDIAPCTTTITCNGVAVTKTGTATCGGACTPVDYTCPGCANGANNPPTCSCAQGDYSCCPTGQIFMNGRCENICTNGATNPPACSCAQGSTSCCPAGQAFISGQCRSGCINGAANFPLCSQCPSGQGFNAAGQCSSECSVNNITPGCIVGFTPNRPTVNPNGSVEFSWTIPKIAGVASRCGFVDLTTATPRPIPGLQNLDSNTDRIRISNIQTTTRFCLVCQFYKLLDNSVLGEAAVHQWVRVIRIGEN